MLESDTLPLISAIIDIVKVSTVACICKITIAKSCSILWLIEPNIELECNCHHNPSKTHPNMIHPAIISVKITFRLVFIHSFINNYPTKYTSKIVHPQRRCNPANSLTLGKSVSSAISSSVCFPLAIKRRAKVFLLRNFFLPNPQMPDTLHNILQHVCRYRKDKNPYGKERLVLQKHTKPLFHHKVYITSLPYSFPNYTPKYLQGFHPNVLR